MTVETLGDLPLAKQKLIANFDEVKHLTLGSSKKELFISCKLGHQRVVTAKAFMQMGEKPRCPICANRELLVGFNDLNTFLTGSLRDDFCWKENPDPTSIIISSGVKVKFFCKKNKVYWETTPNLLKQMKTDCVPCARTASVSLMNAAATKEKLSETFSSLREYWGEENDKAFDEIAANSHYRALWKCPKCDHFWSNTVNNEVTKKIRCLRCNAIENSFLARNPGLLKYWDVEINNVLADEVSAVSTKRYWWKCEKGHSFSKSARAMAKNASCTVCKDQIFLPGMNDLKTINSHLISYWDDPSSPGDFFRLSKEKVALKCPSCGREWKETVQRSFKLSEPCVSCSKKGKSKLEKDFVNWCKKQVGGVVLENTRGVIHPYELDIYLPEESRAIEFNGSYWHSDENLMKAHGLTAAEYHEFKLELCDDKEITLAFVWEQDWLNQQNELKRSVLNFLKDGKVDKNLKKLHG